MYSSKLLDLKAIIGFDWDKGNIDKNYIKHNITNKESVEVFKDPNLIWNPIAKEISDEIRYQIYGETLEGSLITIIFTIRNNKIRIISARKLNNKERNYYNEKIQNNTKI